MCDIAVIILAPRARPESALDQGRRDGDRAGERLEHEAPLCQPRVRDAEARFVHDLVAVEQEVQVDRPRPVAPAGTDTSKLLLHGQQALQERIERGRSPRIAALRKRGWSTTPTGSVSRIEETASTRARDRRRGARARRGSSIRARPGSIRCRCRPCACCGYVVLLERFRGDPHRWSSGCARVVGARRIRDTHLHRAGRAARPLARAGARP